VQATTAGAANGTVLARASLPPFGGTNPVVSFDVSAYNLAVNAGDPLAFVLSSHAAGGTDYLLRARSANTYPGGELTNSSGGIGPGGGWDAIFETFVYAGPTGVGEPPLPAAGAGPQLAPSRPNPVRREAALAFTLPTAGRAARHLRRRAPGAHAVDGERAAHDALGSRADDGGRAGRVYFYRLSADGRDVSRRLVVVD
jgi:hypothetical protein